jgi:hypothetical protein
MFSVSTGMDVISVPVGMVEEGNGIEKGIG